MLFSADSKIHYTFGLRKNSKNSIFSQSVKYICLDKRDREDRERMGECVCVREKDGERGGASFVLAMRDGKVCERYTLDMWEKWWCI